MYFYHMRLGETQGQGVERIFEISIFHRIIYICILLLYFTRGAVVRIYFAKGNVLCIFPTLHLAVPPPIWTGSSHEPALVGYCNG